MSFKKWKYPTTTRAYNSWRSMRRRCYNVNDSAYPNYGMRGITVCDRWRDSFDNFYEDMGNPGEGLSLDRIDNNQGYSPENCKWSTVSQQLNNQRRNVFIEYCGLKMTLSQWAKHLGIKMSTLAKRLERMPPERALSSKRLREWKHGTRAGYEGHGCRCDLCRESNNRRHRERRRQRDDQAFTRNENAA